MSVLKSTNVKSHSKMNPLNEELYSEICKEHKQPIKEITRKNALAGWRKLKGSLSLVTKALAKCEQDRKVVVHGIRLSCRLSHPHTITDVQYLPNRHEYVAVGGQKVIYFNQVGQKKKEIIFQCDYLLYILELKRFIAWSQDDNRIHLLTTSFGALHTVISPCNIQLASFNPNVNEVIIIGRGYFSTWIFQNGAQNLVLKHSSTPSIFAQYVPSEILIQESASKLQRCFVGLGAGVAVFHVRTLEFEYYKKELHQRKITAMAYFNLYRILATGSADGCIKVWDQNWHVLMVFVGHENRITKLCPFPATIPNLVSVSSDYTLRIWNLETQEEVGRAELDGNVNVLGCQPNKDIFHTCSKNFLCLWRIEHLYHLQMAIGSKVECIKVTNHPTYPQRAVVTSSNLSVYLVIPQTGQLITKLMLSANTGANITDTVYAIAEDTMFVSFNNGTIVKASTKSNPCEVTDTWTYGSSSESFSCLILYEHVANSMRNEDMTTLMKNLTTKTVESGVLTAPKNTNRTLLVGGRFNGQICLLDWNKGTINVKTQAHNHSEVLSLVTNIRFDQVISSGRDNVIKVWRFYPFAAEALVPLMSFYCAHTPTHLTILKNILCVAFHDYATLGFSIVTYDLRDSERYDHSPADDHFDDITALATCSKMNIFASASSDKTLKFWNETNKLIRTVQLDATPENLCFYGDRGDLLLGIGYHLYQIPYDAYLPSSYRMTMLSMRINEPKPDAVIPVDEKRLKEIENLCRYHSLTPKQLQVHEDCLTNEEAEQLAWKKQLKQHAFKVFTDRENDLQMIKGGKYYSEKKISLHNKKVRSEAFENYMKLVHEKIPVQIPTESRYLQDDIHEKIHGPYAKEEYIGKVVTIINQESGRHHIDTFPGFFPSWQTVHPHPIPAYFQLKSSTDLNLNGYLPNSVLVKLLWPDRNYKKEEKERKKHEKEVKKLFATLKYPVPVGDVCQEESRWTTLPPVKPPTPVVTDPNTFIPPQTPTKPKLLNVLEAISVKSEPPSVTPEPSPELEPEPSPVPEIIPEKPKPRKIEFKEIDGTSVIKFASRPKTPGSFCSQSPTSPIFRMSAVMEPENVEPSPLQSPEPMADYPTDIQKYQALAWFQKCFPDPVQILPRHWSSTDFIRVLLSAMMSATTNLQRDILAVVIDVFIKYGTENKEEIGEAIKNVLKKDPFDGSVLTEDKKEFVKLALKSLHILPMVIDDMVHYQVAYLLHGDHDLRKAVMASLKVLGLKDSSNYLNRELDTWDIEKEAIAIWEGTVEKAATWLNRWKQLFKDHIQLSVQMLKSGQNIQGQLSRSELPSMGKFIQSSMKDSESVIVDLYLENHAALAEQITYIEVINYFCEIKHESDLQQKPKTPVNPPKDGIDKINSKNTILMLPRVLKYQHLTRVGETHCSTCKPHRETIFYTDYQKPPITYNNYLPHQLHRENPYRGLHLQMPKVNLNPFRSNTEDKDQSGNDPVLVTLRVMPKYFIPALSVVPPIT